MKRIDLDDGFRQMLTAIPAQSDVGKIINIDEALIELESGGTQGIPSEFLAEICTDIYNELLDRGIDLKAGWINSNSRLFR